MAKKRLEKSIVKGFTGARPSSGGGVIVCEAVVTGFVGLQAFGFSLTLCRHSQNLNLAYSDVFSWFCFVLGLVYVCLLGPEKLVWTFGQKQNGYFTGYIVYRCISLFKLCQILGNHAFFFGLLALLWF